MSIEFHSYIYSHCFVTNLQNSFQLADLKLHTHEMILHSPLSPPFYFQSSNIWLCWVPPVRGIIQCLPLCDLLISHSLCTAIASNGNFLSLSGWRTPTSPSSLESNVIFSQSTLTILFKFATDIRHLEYLIPHYPPSIFIFLLALPSSNRLCGSLITGWFSVIACLHPLQCKLYKGRNICLFYLLMYSKAVAKSWIHVIYWI